MARLTSSAEFALERVELQGVQRSSAEAIQGRLAPVMGSNLFDLELDRIAQVAREDPWVPDVSVRRVLPRTLRLPVIEREPAALAVIRGVVHVVDPTGHVIGPAGSRPVDDLPVLTGMDKMSDEELVRALRDGVRMVERLRDNAAVFAERSIGAGPLSRRPGHRPDGGARARASCSTRAGSSAMSATSWRYVT